MKRVEELKNHGRRKGMNYLKINSTAGSQFPE
jgi:hypothetical protein